MDIRFPLFALATITLAECAEPNMDQGEATTSPTYGLSYTVSLQGDDGTYVACELALDSAAKAMLVCSRTTPGDWEKFTLYELGDNKVALQAANGKYVCCDDFKGGLLVADRDRIGDWETFTMIPEENGKIALKAWNGMYVTADFGLTDGRKGALFGSRQEANAWERFTLVKDTVGVL